MGVDELMQFAAGRAASGDSAGELEAYRQVDELGDAEAAIFLGNALRRRGDVDRARAAFKRAEDRGHREAAMSLGNLLADIGDEQGAKAAYLRSIESGSTIAALNLGLMLAQDGESDEALGYLRRAAEGGDSAGFWGIGRIHEERRDWAVAAEAYRRGAELGDAACAYGLGSVLYRLGDHVGSRAAFERAIELGHEGAAAVLAALGPEDGSGIPGSARPDVGQLWADVTALYGVLASQRQELGRRWIAGTMVVQEQQTRLAALKGADEDLRKRFATIRDRFRAEPERGKNYGSRTPIPAPSSTEWLSAKSGHAGQWGLAEQQVRAFDTDLEAARAAFQQAEGRAFGGSLRLRGTDALGRVAQRLSGLEGAIGAASRQVAEAEQSRESASHAAAERSREAFNPIASRAASSARELPTVLQPWSSAVWDSWSLDDETNLGLRFAYGGVLIPKPDPRLGSNAEFGAGLRIPWAFPLHDSWYLMHDGPSRATAHGFVRSMMLRQVLSVAPGEVKFCVFDPVGLGQSAGDLLDLAEYDADLIGGKVWSSSRDLEARLAELSAHIELVIQKYLRTSYQTIDEFNDAAGEVAEPYRMLVLFDFPSGLTAESAARLKSIVENGPRCGVFTLMVVDASVQAPYGVDVAQLPTSMRRLNLQGGFSDNLDGYQLEASFEHDVLPERTEVAKRIIDSVGRASVYRTEAAVTFDKVFGMYGNVAARGLRPELGDAAARTKAGDPKTWWRDDSTRGLFAPVGQKGARDVAVLGFDSSDHAAPCSSAVLAPANRRCCTPTSAA